MTLLALLAGALVGSAPTADALGRLWGVDLRASGTGNPGTNNALRTGGKALAAAVLVVEFAKGAAAVWIGRWLGADAGGALAAVSATAANVYNPWFGFRGGKGLAITGGTLLAAWPPAVPLLVAALAATVAAIRRSGPASLVALGAYVLAALLGLVVTLPAGWGIASPGWRVVMALAGTALMAPKHWADAVRPPARRPSRPPV